LVLFGEIPEAEYLAGWGGFSRLLGEGSQNKDRQDDDEFGAFQSSSPRRTSPWRTGERKKLTL
jgi:hypothetical protein